MSFLTLINYYFISKRCLRNKPPSFSTYSRVFRIPFSKSCHLFKQASSSPPFKESSPALSNIFFSLSYFEFIWPFARLIAYFRSLTENFHFLYSGYSFTFDTIKFSTLFIAHVCTVHGKCFHFFITRTSVFFFGGWFRIMFSHIFS